MGGTVAKPTIVHGVGIEAHIFQSKREIQQLLAVQLRLRTAVLRSDQLRQAASEGHQRPRRMSDEDYEALIDRRVLFRFIDSGPKCAFVVGFGDREACVGVCKVENPPPKITSHLGFLPCGDSRRKSACFFREIIRQVRLNGGRKIRVDALDGGRGGEEEFYHQAGFHRQMTQEPGVKRVRMVRFLTVWDSVGHIILLAGLVRGKRAKPIDTIVSVDGGKRRLLRFRMDMVHRMVIELAHSGGADFISSYFRRICQYL